MNVITITHYSLHFIPFEYNTYSKFEATYLSSQMNHYTYSFYQELYS